MGDMLNDRDYGFEEMAWQDSAEWYELSMTRNGIVVPAKQVSYKVNNKIVKVYLCEVDCYGNMNTTLNIVTTMKDVLDKIALKYTGGKMHNDKGDYVLSYHNFDSRGIMNFLASIADLPRMQMKVDKGNVFKISFMTPPPIKFRKRMNDFGVYYNSNTQIWSAKLSPSDLTKMLTYFKKQYNLK